MARNSEKQKLGCAPFLEFSIIFQEVCFKWKVFWAVSEESSTKIFWSLFLEKYYLEQNLRRKLGSFLEKAKIQRRTILRSSQSFAKSVCFKWKVCATAFQRAIKEHFLIAFRREIHNTHLNKTGTEKLARFLKKPKMRGALFLEFSHFSSGMFWMEGISRRFPKSPTRTLFDPIPYR